MRILMIVLFVVAFAFGFESALAGEVALRITIGAQCAVCFSFACLILVGLAFFGDEADEVAEE